MRSNNFRHASPVPLVKRRLAAKRLFAALISATALQCVIPIVADEPVGAVAKKSDKPAAENKAGWFKLLDLEGVPRPLAETSAKAIGVVFLSHECPICTQYIPELNRLAAEQACAGVPIYGVLSDPTLTRLAAVQFQKEYHVGFPLLFDASGELGKALKVRTTPEAFVFDQAGAVVYRGRIDDKWVSVGRSRTNANSHDWVDALNSVIAGKPPSNADTSSIGCPFEAWEHQPTPRATSYCRDIAPILNAHCVHCHRPGESAPFSLTDYSEAAKHAKQIARTTGERTMPPWKAAPGHFADERRLTAAEIALIGQWASSNAAEGDAADLPAPPKFVNGWRLGKPDMIVMMAEPYALTSEGRDEYRCFALPIQVPHGKTIRSVEYRPSNRRIVHHAQLTALPHRAAVDKLATGDGKSFPSGLVAPGERLPGALGIWTPGYDPLPLPAGLAAEWPAGADMILQLHLHPSGKPETEQSSVGLYLTDEKPRGRLKSMVLMNRLIDLPPGEANYALEASLTLKAPVEIYGVFPHMHLLGRTVEVTATLPDGTIQSIIAIRDWDFNWQMYYQYASPLRLPAGARLHGRWSFDNSAANPANPIHPPQRVGYGEQTTNEMALVALDVIVAKKPQQRPASPAR